MAMMQERGEPGSPSPPRRLPLTALFAANAVSMAGNQITRLAVPWFVLT
ncbi:MAG: hypothetical protein H0U10_15950, partial [Chloroflexia bacterium]|nr:hypothetical protein [Chloroflexia bacterium]